MLAVICALGAALAYAVASVLQQRSASAESTAHSLRLGLLTRLARRPAWLVGIAVDVAGYVLQFIALGRGALVVVQPLLVSGMLFALPLGARLGGVRLRPVDWASAVVTCAGLTAFLLVAAPAPGHDDVRLGTWIILLAVTGVVAGGLLLLAVGRHRRPATRAALLSAVAGVSYGLAAALTKTCAHLLSVGPTVLLTHWQPYVLAVIGLGGMVVAQSAFQLGSLEASLPTMTVVDPVASIIIGALAFGESISIGRGRAVIEVVSLVAMSIGVFALVSTPAIRRLHEEEHRRVE